MVRRPMFSFHVRLGAWRLGKTSFLRPKSNDNVFVVPFISSPQGKVTLDYPIRLCVWELVDATTQRTCPLPSHKVIAKKRCMDKQKSRGFHRSICTNGGGRIQFPPRISQMLVKQTSLSKGYIFAWLVLNIALQWTKDALRSAEHQGSENSVVSNWRGNKEFLASGNVLFATRLSKASASGFRRKYFRVHVAGVLYNVRHGHHNYEHENPQQPTGGTGHHADVQFFDWAVYVKDWVPH